MNHKDRPEISVIVTFFDETDFVRTALNSISKNRLRSIEIILVNDNPARFTRTEMEDMVRGFDVRLIQQGENLGCSAARNAALSVARGTWIGFLDADDFFTESGLKQHLEFAQNCGADIAHAATYVSSGPNGPMKLNPRNKKLHMQRGCGPLSKMNTAQFAISSWSSLYRRDFIQRERLRFDVSLHSNDDRQFALRAMIKARSIAFLDKAVRVWRHRTNSVSTASPTYRVHNLKIQHIKSCLGLIREEVAHGRLPPIFEKRELFHTVSRLIWGIDILPNLSLGSPEYRDLGEQIVGLLGSKTFGKQIFEDPVISKISRVGLSTSLGRISRRNFFDIHAAMRAGDFERAHATCKENSNH